MKVALGVLFVHGIGDQPQGDTLVSFGDPLHKWVREWLESAEEIGCVKSASVSVMDANIRPVQLEEETPANARLLLRIEDTADRQHTAEWLLLESWWAHSLLPPSFVDVLIWALTAGPWLAVTHFTSTIQRAWTERGAGLWGLVTAALGTLGGALLAYLMALALEAVAVVLLVVAVIPIPQLREFIADVQAWLANSIGDSKRLTESDIQFESMAAEVRRDIEWLGSRADKVAVIAHSQGAAVAHRALEGIGPGTVQLFITLGSGLNKLHLLRVASRRAHGQREYLPLWLLGSAIVLFVFTLPLALIQLSCLMVAGCDSGSTAYPAWFIALGEPGWLRRVVLVAVTYGLFGVVVVVAQVVGRIPAAWQLKFPQGTVEWRDYYASSDPVSNGPLMSGPVPRPISTEVWNRASVIADHSSYWANRDGFVAQIAQRLLSLTGPGFELVCPVDQDRLKEASNRRRWRVRWAPIGRLALAASVLFVIAGTGSRAAEIGSMLAGFKPLADRLPPVVGGLVAGTLSAIQGIDPVLLGIGLLSGVGLLVHAISLLLLRWWQAHDLTILCARAAYDSGAPWLGVFLLMHAVLLATAVLLFLTSGREPFVTVVALATQPHLRTAIEIGWGWDGSRCCCC